MAASGLLPERDLRALAAVVQDGLRDDPGEAMPWVVLHRLQQIVPCNLVEFTEQDPRRQESIVQQIIEDSEPYLAPSHEPNPEYWQLRPSFLPYSSSADTGDQSSVLRWSDFYTQSEFKNHPFCDYIRRFDATTKYGIFVLLPMPAGRIQRVALFRSNRDFTERDRLVLQLLRPHLYDVYLDAERRRRGVPHLSRREREVLQLVSQGYSNADIARILFISVSTVRKHMENIFNRTGVRTRAAAAALALTHASLAIPPASPEIRR